MNGYCHRLFFVFLCFSLLRLPQAWATSKPELPTDTPSNIAPNTQILINVPARELTLFHEGKIVYQFPVAVGAPGYKTPLGERFLDQIIWNPWWLPPDSTWAKGAKDTPPGPGNPLGPVKMSLGEAILLHGTTKEYTIGRAASHGCMRMRNEDAKTLAWWIQSHLTEQTDPALFKAYTSNYKTIYIKLAQKIPVDIQYEAFNIDGEMLTIHPDIYWRIAKRPEKIIEWLTSYGFEKDKMNMDLLNTAIQISKKETISLSLKELSPEGYKIARRKTKKEKSFHEHEALVYPVGIEISAL